MPGWGTRHGWTRVSCGWGWPWPWRRSLSSPPIWKKKRWRSPKAGVEAGFRANATLAATLGEIGRSVVVLSADNMTPGATSTEFGPATTLFERFLWRLFDGDRQAWDSYVAQGPNKTTLQQ